MTTMGGWQATIADRGGASNPAVVPLNGGRFSWCVDDTGTANVEVDSAVLRAADLLPPTRLAGRRLSWDHGGLGPWVGTVLGARTFAEGGAEATEVVARALDGDLEGRALPKLWDAGMGNAGDALVRAAAAASTAADPLRLAFAADRGGPAVASARRATDVRDLLTGLARDLGWHWRLDHATETLEFGRRLGRDLRSSVVLAYGGNVSGFSLDFDLGARANEVRAVPGGAPYARAREVVVRDDADVSAYGRRQVAERFADATGPAGLRALAEGRLARLLAQGHTAELVVLDTNRAWGSFEEGDTVTAVLGPANAMLAVRVMVRLYDLERDELRLSCDVEEVVWPT